jgi:glutathione S-transferase
MSELILHHYAGSPFSEKIRLILGFKGLAWQSVNVPVVMPKPDVVALTGGYRKTPFLQIGADVYCDTALMARVIDQRHPLPPLFPADQPLATTLAQWADSTLFWTMIPYVMQPAGAAAIFNNPAPEMMKAFAADRGPFTAGMTRQTVADATVALRAYLARLAAQLAKQQADGRAFLFGAAPGIADFSVAHCLWFIRLAGPMAAALEPHPLLGAWLDRVLAFGHGQKAKLSSADALAIAAAATAHAPTSVEPGLGFSAGTAVTVAATDYGSDPVAGTLVGLSADEVVLRRSDERAGTVHVHFPRLGFQIKEQR